ncbi:hypothetical protein HPP92_022556 [Vanilla planifolia]|uniref:Transmembrane protein n=1 Tax=Vanilla planifolia TaxID=51239 RepID=A0A835PPW0_VANPL|nr:hypothetical protein HPP92_022556 [Vanilla planifolia]
MSSLKERSHKTKRKSAPTCLFFCCGAGSVVADSHHLEEPLDAAGPVCRRKRKKFSCFFSSLLRRKKRELTPKANGNSSQPSPGTRETPAGEVQVSEEVHNLDLPLLTPRFNSRIQPAPAGPRGRRGRSKPGSPESHRPAEARVREPVVRRRLDQKAGVVVLGFTFVVMISYGRAAAVVCLCVFLYLTAFLRQKKQAEEGAERAAEAKRVDLGSEQYKKRVVLEGLLERNHRRTLTASRGGYER